LLGSNQRASLCAPSWPLSCAVRNPGCVPSPWAIAVANAQTHRCGSRGLAFQGLAPGHGAQVAHCRKKGGPRATLQAVAAGLRWARIPSTGGVAPCWHMTLMHLLIHRLVPFAHSSIACCLTCMGLPPNVMVCCQAAGRLVVVHL
jgi:hypothetical protein